MKKFLLPLLFIAGLNATLSAQVLYSSTAYTSRFNPGLGSLGTPIIAYDDVTIPTTTSNEGDSISITKIKVGIRRAPNAPETNVSLYYSTFQEDSTGNNKPTVTAHVFLGKVFLPKNIASLVTSVISLGDSVTALIKLSANSGIAKNGKQKFLIGASFDNPSPANGIILAKETTDNVDSLWIDNTDNDKSMYATSFNSHLPATYYLEVFGNSANAQTNADRSTFAEVSNDKMITTSK